MLVNIHCEANLIVFEKIAVDRTAIKNDFLSHFKLVPFCFPLIWGILKPDPMSINIEDIFSDFIK